jgi:hypothetical protein
MKKSIKILFLLIIIGLFFNVLVSGEEIKKFNPSDPRTWEFGTDNEVKSITTEEIYTRYSGYPEVIEKLWNKFDEKAKNDFLETEIFRKTKLRISLENLGYKDLKFKDGKLTDSKGAVFDMNNFPKDLKKIIYDSQKGFIYSTEGDGYKGSLVVNKGGYGADGFYGTGSPIDGAKWNGKGDAVQDSQKGLILNNGAEFDVKNKDNLITYKQKFNDKEGLVEIVSSSRAKLTNSEAKDSKNGIIGAEDIATFAVFDDDPVDSKQYARIGSKEVNFYGEKMDLEILRDFEKVVGSGIGNGVNFINGDFKLKFKGENIYPLRDIKNIKYKVDLIQNNENLKQTYGIKTTKGGINFFYVNKDGRVILGDVYNTVPSSENPDGREVPKKLGPVVTGTKVEFPENQISELPSGLSQEQLIEELKKFDKGTVSFETYNQLTTSIDELIADKSLKAILSGNKEAVNELKNSLKTASDWGFIQPISSEDVDKKLKEAVISGVRTGSSALGLFVEKKDSTQSRVQSTVDNVATNLNLIGDVFGFSVPLNYQQGLKTFEEYSTNVDDALKLKTALESYQSKYNGNLPPVRIIVQSTGNLAVVTIIPDKVVVNGDSREVFNPEPIQFTASLDSFRKIRNMALESNVLNNKLYEKYKAAH